MSLPSTKLLGYSCRSSRESLLENMALGSDLELDYILCYILQCFNKLSDNLAEIVKEACAKNHFLSNRIFNGF